MGMSLEPPCSGAPQGTQTPLLLVLTHPTRSTGCLLQQRLMVIMATTSRAACEQNGSDGLLKVAVSV